ncbi:MAG: response regulator [Deltaproteobacteria bacterium]|nr:response regulator [Deltaproteobacteria bacterium]
MTDIKDLDKNMPILVVDDFSTVRRVVKNCLSGLGFKNVFEAENFASAKEQISEQSIKFIISDFKLPDVNDESALLALLDQHSPQPLPVLLVVNENQKKELLSKSKVKQEQLLVKPFTKQMLQEKIQSLI